MSSAREDDSEAARRAAALAVGEAAVHDFAAAAAVATDADELRRALAAASQWAAVDVPVSLQLADDEAGGIRDPAPPGAVSVPIRAGEGRKVWGNLLLRKRGPEAAPRPANVRRRLETLATLAAFALERIHAGSSTPVVGDVDVHPEVSHDPAAVHDATLLGAVLPFAIGQARRHSEPLSILCLAIEQLRAIRELLGRERADRVVERVGGRIAGLLRCSDLVGRLDDDRLMAILPRADLQDAVRIGEKLIRRISEPGLLDIPLDVTLSIGAASLPASATTLGGLVSAADAVLSEVRARGPGSVAAAPPSGRARDAAEWARAAGRGRVIC